MEKLAKQQGCTILLVTHDNRILDLADRIIYMEDGCLINTSDSFEKREQKSYSSDKVQVMNQNTK